MKGTEWAERLRTPSGRWVSLRSIHPTYNSHVSQPEHVQHRGVALFLDLRRVHERAPAGGVEAGCDGDVLLAANLERHRRSVEAGADVELPQLLQRRVVIGRHRSVGQADEDEAAGGPHAAADPGSAQVDAFPDLARNGVERRQVAF